MKKTQLIHLADREKGSIHLIDGEKGGIGKSTFSRILIEFIQDETNLEPKKLEIIDADKEQPLVGRTYAPHHYLKENKNEAPSTETAQDFNALIEQIPMIYFSENQKISAKTDIILELSQKQAVVINLPAAVFGLVNNWFLDSGMLELLNSMDIPIYKWFVTDGCNEGIETLKKSYQLYENKIIHIIVKNKGLSTQETDWWAFDRDEELRVYLEEYKDITYTIDLPFLSTDSVFYETVKKQNLPFREVTDIKKAKELGFLMAQAGRCQKWRTSSFEQLDTLPWANKKNKSTSTKQDDVAVSSK